MILLGNKAFADEIKLRMNLRKCCIKETPKSKENVLISDKKDTLRLREKRQEKTEAD